MEFSIYTNKISNCKVCSTIDYFIFYDVMLDTVLYMYSTYILVFEQYIILENIS